MGTLDKAIKRGVFEDADTGLPKMVRGLHAPNRWLQLAWISCCSFPLSEISDPHFPPQLIPTPILPCSATSC
jgi:hypothetical protein